MRDRRGGDDALVAAIRDYATLTGDAAGTERLVRLFEKRRTSDATRAWTHLLLAELAIARGRWRAAGAQFDSAAVDAPWAALQLRARYASLPWSPLAPGELAALRDTRLGARIPEGADAAITMGAESASTSEALRLHLLALLGERRGARADADRWVARLARSRGGAPGDSTYAVALVESARATLALDRGRPREAMRVLDADPAEPMRRWKRTRRGSLPRERWLHAEVLFAAGRAAEARGWYESIADLAPSDLVFLAPAQLRLGEIAERQGDRRGPQHTARAPSRCGAVPIPNCAACSPTPSLGSRGWAA